ncbi:MAG: 16S rRNA (cytidine(1402)-2'-O)-methyltransferase [Nitrospirae bacterium]|nr:16S rRNA (cytidine(1402)-2'-O)-methyltransferase [Nitrospirota bacterium]
MAGSLYIVSTPIGNWEDITLRAIRILRDAAIVAAEDTQHTQALCERYGIQTPLTSYHNLNKEDKTPLLIRRLQEGQDVALVSDTGTPVVSDPGAWLITQALKAGIRVIPVPGPSAILAALSVSGLPTEPFLFQGFIPRQATARRRLLETLSRERRTLVLFESPDRLLATLETIGAMFGRRRIVLAKDLTKPSEELIRGTAAEVLRAVTSRPRDGDITLIIEGYRSRK